MKEIIISSLGVLLLVCVLLLMLNIRSSSTISDTYKQKHKVFVPDTMPMKLSPEDSITSIKQKNHDQIWD